MAVHPTPLYVVATMFAVFWLLWRVRVHRHGPGWLFGLYLILSGLSRFAVEFVRAKSDRVLGAVSLAQVFSVAVVVIGAWLMRRYAVADLSAQTITPEPGR
jgi:phosphatidylglycerol:prolipoprotein diacylglycerol transferase